MIMKTLTVSVVVLFVLLGAGGSGLCSFFEAGSMAQAVTDPPPEGSVLKFDNVSNAYPSTDRDPADSKPMVSREESHSNQAVKPEGELPSGVCPLMHDRSVFRAHARYIRERDFRRLEMREGNAVVYHSSGEWGRIVRAGGAGIRLLSTGRDDASGKWIARVSFSSDFLCGDGIFEVEVDDWLTSEISVLAIGKDVIVISVAGRLAYMQTEDAPDLQWRTVWDTDISLEYEQDRPAASSPVTNTKNAAPRKKINPRNAPRFKGNR